jgi:hypothetical protein
MYEAIAEDLDEASTVGRSKKRRPEQNMWSTVAKRLRKAKRNQE